MKKLTIRRTQGWICNVSAEQADELKKVIQSSDIWNDHKESYRLRFRGRNPNRKQLLPKYGNCVAGTQSSLRKEDSTWFSVYLGTKKVDWNKYVTPSSYLTLVQDIKNHILEIW